jgi:hypothetical protein
MVGKEMKGIFCRSYPMLYNQTQAWQTTDPPFRQRKREPDINKPATV